MLVCNSEVGVNVLFVLRGDFGLWFGVKDTCVVSMECVCFLSLGGVDGHIDNGRGCL